MSQQEDKLGALYERIHGMEAALASLRAALTVLREVDETLEQAMRRQWSVPQTMHALLERACALCGGEAIVVTTLQHAGIERFAWPNTAPFAGLDLTSIIAQTMREGDMCRHDVVAYRLDVDGQQLGCAVLLLTPDNASDQALERLAIWAEQVDNYLAAQVEAQRKQAALRELSDALRHPILDEGINQAIATLARHVPYADLALALRYDAGAAHTSLNWRVVTPDATISPASGADEAQQAAISALLHGASQPLIAQLGLSSNRQEVALLASDEHTVVGRISVGFAHTEPLGPFGRDVLDRFADYIRQRVVDFNKEWRRLSHNFPQPVVRRLLQESNYHERFLSPREREVAVMFCDISGFTRLSETVLKEPALIGQLINRWSSCCVEFIWETGGVFDKMVGDCIIGLWGPPFYERDPQALCRAAAEAARKIRDYTATLADEFPALAAMEPPVGVATGVNWCPLFVGTFGPDENFTGFSSGMNNTARLQGVAARNEILCMDSFVVRYGDADAFGEERHATVKNVAQPLVFRALR
jgi:class 3 adenylate cyclase